LEKYLLTKEDSGVSSSELRHMGKQAAVRYVQQETPLNDSVAEFAKKSGLNLEQIKRLVSDVKTYSLSPELWSLQQRLVYFSCPCLFGR